ncbi:TonB-dependent receptor [Paludibacter sp.]|uniref:SusC/RagA family TonB-linked outer membrane protein n=1 Tax=Paludibacter sp. TaxID=1898105 RepID=UPI0025EF23B9|nr:TonB-dependent receptor [Paludibacter sp.]
MMLSVSICAYAQNKHVIKGVVTDSKQEPLIGAAVIVKGNTSQGTVTDVNGQFTLSVSDQNQTLIVSYIGMLQQEVAITSKSQNLKIVLMDDRKQLDEVVVVGYGTSKKSDISGSVVSVNKEEMLKKVPTNIVQGMKGMAAGVVISAQDGSPDANSSIQIRGVATINGDSKPLYVIDGVVVGKDANFLNPSDVESMEILKDASATAIYGSAGANGVVMITTKHGSVGSAHITFTADYGLQNLAKKLDVGDADQYARNIRQARANDGNTLVNQIFSAQYDGKRKTIDWQKEMTRPALRQQYTLSAQGGTEKTQQYFSLSYLNHDGIVINSNAKRLTGRASTVTKVADFLEIGGDINFIHSESYGSNAGIGNNGNLSSIRDWAFLCPTMDYIDPATGAYVSPNVKNANGTYGTPIQGNVGSYDGNLGNNIVAEQMEQTGKSKHNQTIISAYANIKLLKGLTFKTVGSYNFSADNWYNFWGNKKRYMPDGVTQVVLYNYDTKYNLGINNSNYNVTQLESYLTYNWKNAIHNLTLMAGNSVSKEFGNWSNASGYDFPGDNIRSISLTNLATSRTGNGAYDLDVHNLSYFGRLQYSLKDRYILTGTMRRDGSSRFGAENTWGTFPSAAVAWRISEEDFMKSFPTISNLKLRLGWGQTGNAGNMNSDLATPALTSANIMYNFYPQNGVLGAGSSSKSTVVGTAKTLVDPKLKWETNEQKNIGIDLGLFNNNLNITVDYFTRDSKDLLNYLNIRPSSGYNQVYTNLGGIDNKGIEFSINYKKQLNKDWNFGATVTGSSIKNKIKGIGNDIFFENTSASGDGSNQGAVGAPSGTHWNNHSIMRDGYAVGSFYGYKVDHIYKNQAEIDADNAKAKAAGHTAGYNNGSATVPGDYKFKDLNGDGFIDEKDMTVLGNGFPKLNYGLTLTASYKNWDMMIYGYGVAGAQIYSYSAMTLTNMFPSDNGTTPNILNEVAQNAWSPTNTNGTYTRLSFLDKNYNMRGSDAWLKNGDYFKIGTIQLGYSFDKRVLKALHLQSMRVNASVQNVLCISSYNKYGDPEAGQGSVLFTGLDTGRYPMPRVYSLGLNVQF